MVRSHRDIADTKATSQTVKFQMGRLPILITLATILAAKIKEVALSESHPDFKFNK